LSIKADRPGSFFQFQPGQHTSDGVALLSRIDRGKIHEHILTPLDRIANAIYDEDQYD
jgi:hypothetical protein